MDWSDERYVRVYTRDTADWLCLSFLAQGLFCLLLRKVDRAGVLPLGRAGRKAVAIAVGHAHQWPLLEPALDELLADGCLRIEGDLLVVPNFIEAQEALASDKARAKKAREKRRDLANSGAVTQIPPAPTGTAPASRPVTERHEPIEPRDGGVAQRDVPVTGCDQTVTPSRAVPCCAVPPKEEALPPARAREAGSDARSTIEAAALDLSTLPGTLAVLRVLHAAGKTSAAPSPVPRTRRRDEALIGEAGVEAAAARILAAWETAHSTLGWYADVIAGKPSRLNGASTPKVNDPAPIGTNWGGPAPF